MADHTGAPVPSTGYLGSGPVSTSFKFLKGCVVLTGAPPQHPVLRLCPVPMTPTQSKGDLPRAPPSRPESAAVPVPPAPAPPAAFELASASLAAPPAELPDTPPVGDPAEPDVDEPVL